MAGLTYFKCYPQDFLNGVMGLGPNEGWVYTLIVMQQYDRAEGVPVNVRALAARAMMRPSSVEAALRRLVELGKIVVEGERWANPRAAKEITSARLLQQIAIENGQRGGRKSKQKPNEIKGDQNPTLTQPSSQPEARSHKPEEDAGEAKIEDPTKVFETAILKACPDLQGAYANAPGLWDLSPVNRWLAAGYDLHADIIPTVREYLSRPKHRTPRSWAFFEGMLAEFREKRLNLPKAIVDTRPSRLDSSGALIPTSDGSVRVGWRRADGWVSWHHPEDREITGYWRKVVFAWKQSGAWSREDLGPAPGEPNCVVPSEAIAEVESGVYNPALPPAGSRRQELPPIH
jgi:uncharacterized protein YdaU (DUF1376 family)